MFADIRTPVRLYPSCGSNSSSKLSLFEKTRVLNICLHNCLKAIGPGCIKRGLLIDVLIMKERSFKQKREQKFAFCFDVGKALWIVKKRKMLNLFFGLWQKYALCCQTV